MRVMQAAPFILIAMVVGCAKSPPPMDEPAAVEAEVEADIDRRVDEEVASDLSHAAGELVVEDGRTVSIEYTLSLDDGSIADTNVGGEPLRYLQGGEQILPYIEAELAGMAVGQEKQLVVPPDQGYGLIDPTLMQPVPIDAVPADARSPGAQLMTRDQQGNERVVKVHEVRDDAIVIDFNHPLAGETLHFDIRIVDIQ